MTFIYIVGTTFVFLIIIMLVFYAPMFLYMDKEFGEVKEDEFFE